MAQRNTLPMADPAVSLGSVVPLDELSRWLQDQLAGGTLQDLPSLYWQLRAWLRQRAQQAGQSQAQPVLCRWGHLPDGSAYQQFQAQVSLELAQLQARHVQLASRAALQFNGLLTLLARARAELDRAQRAVWHYQAQAMDTDQERYQHLYCSFHTDRPDPSSTGYWDPNGWVSLGLVQGQDVPYQVQVDLANSTRNGFPGNLWEIKSLGQADQGIYQAESVQTVQAGLDLASIQDGQPETYFLWERIMVDPVQRDPRYARLKDVPNALLAYYNYKAAQVKSELQLGEGVWYDPRKLVGDVPWTLALQDRAETDIGWAPPEGGQLKLVLVLTLNQPQRLSELQLLGYFSSLDPHRLGYRIEQLELVTADNQRVARTELGHCSPDRPGWQITCPTDQPVLALRLTLVQKDSYPTRIGHPFWVQRTQVKKSGSGMFGLVSELWNGRNTRVSFKRVPAPAQGQPVTSVSGRGSTPLEDVLGIVAARQWGIPAQLFGGTSKVVTKEIEGPFWDVFTAKRWSIGIRDLRLVSREYERYSSIISPVLELTGRWQAVSLIVQEQVPESFPRDQVWVRYYLQVGRTGEWHELRPLDRPDWPGSDPAAEVLYRADLVPDSAADEPSTSFRVRIDLNRPEDQPQHSPVVAGFTLRFVR